MGSKTASASLGGVSMKHLSLVTLTFQNSALILIMHYSRVMPTVNGQRYHTSTSVFLNEVIKLGISLTMALYDISRTLPSNTTVATLASSFTTAMFTNESWKLAVPALLYTLQNTLQYVAVSNLDAASFQVTYQLKILTTAMFSVIMLGRTLTPRKWTSLLLLIIGVSIVQFPEHASKPVSMETLRDSSSKIWPRSLEELRDLGSHAAGQLVKRSASYEGIEEDRYGQATQMNRSVGLVAVLIACAISGLAGVSFEKILKESNTKQTSLWVRNCQLSFWSLFPALFLGVIWKDGEVIAKTGFFVGYNWVVWTAITFQAFGGVIVALVINYADNIAKNFATSISIVLSCLASVYFFNFKVTPSFFIGTSVVLFATYLYSKPEQSALLGSTKIFDFEKTMVDRSPQYDDARRSSVKSHLRGDSGGSSRPGTPTVERKFPKPVMHDEHYYLPDDFERGNASRHASQYAVHQPQFKQSAKPVAPRDRYRATAFDNPAYDAVEDDDAYGQEVAFDSFDERLLRQPYDDRQRQAARGEARLSLASGVGKGFGNAGRGIECMIADCSVEYQSYTEQPIRGQLSRFAFNPHDFQESSSDVHLGPSSSPAWKASQRRAEHSGVVESQQALQPLVLEEQRRDSRRPAPMQGRLAHERSFRPLGSRSFEDEQQLAVAQQKENVDGNYQPISLRRSATNLNHGPPVVQGIQLVPITALPDRLRTIFPFPTFNAVQSRSFDKVFRSDDNFVLASPTGSGKTAILELAICRAIATNNTGQYKIVYQAPTKALCSERQRDWEKKFNPIGLKCAELTGDSDFSDLSNVQGANIIITTPEKWDSVTRRWKDHEKLMKLVKLFLIDEVHILKEDRGAVLEAVVSRMKSIGTDVRFVALSATVPNFHDVAAWLGKNAAHPHEPAANEKFGEEFRPVKLRKHVCGYVYNSPNDFAFEKSLDSKLPDVITRYSEGKPLMIFCATRASTVKTAKLVANWWAKISGRDRMWNPPSKQIPVNNKDLLDTVASGVAFHHAGLDSDDRLKVESGFLNGDINVICCTSTLAVGVNLPCHLVIIKNTVTFCDQGLQEYSDLEMMQMLGRAGRPQFDDSAVAVIMTRQAKVSRYEMMVTGQDLLESKLHLNLIDHMNAETGLGTIRDLDSARNWLTGTFLYVRLKQNPEHYKLQGARSGQDIEEQVDDICYRDISLLREYQLLDGDEYFRCTEFGHAMARYYVRFETMKIFMGLEKKASLSEILSAVSQAHEFSTIRFRQGEKSIYKTLNKSPSIRFPIPVNLDLPAQKVSLLIQSILGSADISWDGENGKHKSQYVMETQVIFKYIHSLVRCIIDCQICLGDSVSIHNALMLARSLGARAWDESPLQMRQVANIGVVAVRKLVNAGIKSIEDLEATDAHRIEAIVGRNPPFGLKVLGELKTFPKLRVSLSVQPSSITKTGEGVKIQVKADIGFINETPPKSFNNKLIYVCLLAETSDGRKIHFARISGPKLGLGQSLVFPALLESPDLCINCYVMCDGIGNMRGATVKPRIAPSMFPSTRISAPDTPQPNMSKRRAETSKVSRKRSVASEDFGDDGIDDDELMKATSVGDLDFDHIENYDNPTDAVTRKNTAKNKTKDKSFSKQPNTAADDEIHEPRQLDNGKWACNHRCKDRMGCKHLCCKEGTDKPPKKAATKRTTSSDNGSEPVQKRSTQNGKQTQTKLQLSSSKRKISSPIEEIDLTHTEKKRKADFATNGPKDFRGLHQLHKSVQKDNPPSSLHAVMHKKSAYCYGEGGEHALSFMNQPTARRPQSSSDYDDIPLDDFTFDFDDSKPNVFQQQPMEAGNISDFDALVDYPPRATVFSRSSDLFGDNDSLLGDAMIGIADSETLATTYQEDNDLTQATGMPADMDWEADFEDDDFMEEFGIPTNAADDFKSPNEQSSFSTTHPKKSLPPPQPRLPFLDNSSSSHAEHDDIKPAKVSSDQVVDEEYNSLDLSDMSHPQPVEDVKVKEEQIPDGFKDLEPWLFQEFGDIVELVDE
ncbi:hypothetical protein P153DRAFT_288291 [Dothidotthia symphoricarpi CBS 119687]|uniref:DNA 3'-5' helicase n=1 Tax=Dothidotthia symphoricarpi CBS 119687 TaxID=1392245 RepID=A0A6A6AIB1_9PLEO|nr:uncharacterized protein P153DRAFT_288291 [Dothidotthia symphoricarpi CBS 119687]KAF2130634.1 hypothetical protein P153DRAFT_288291 [Dothidotthia symphoricarpi CBS 119687]